MSHRAKNDIINLYNDNDSKILEENIENIIKQAEDVGSKIVKPTALELWDIIFTVRDFVKEKRRKIYGGFALNKLIENVDARDKFYADDDIKSWDIDFYSPDPINDAREIANRLKEKGYRHIQAREAQHEETYKVFAETNDCADISYVPRNIYNKMPYTEVNGLYLTGPQFMMIDYFRVMTDPLSSFFRLEKTFTRLCLMMKHFPLPNATSSIDVIPPERDLDIAIRTVHEFLKNRTSLIVVGMYAYNHIIRESGIADTQKVLKRANNKNNNNNNNKNNYNKNNYNKKSNIDYSDINYYEVITTQYKKDARELILSLQDKFLGIGKTKITYRENYPFFQYLGYSVDIMYDNVIICRLYHYNSRCTPYFDVPALYFKDGEFDDDDGTIRIGSFATLMMYNLIDIMRARTNNDKNTMNLYYTMISHLTQMRNYYFKKTNKTLMDESLFQEFIVRCVGETTTPQMEKANRIEKKIKAGKKYSWSYNPYNERDTKSDGKYVFKNSSGNFIKNVKNMKITLTDLIIDEEIDNINEEEEQDEEHVEA